MKIGESYRYKGYLIKKAKAAEYLVLTAHETEADAQAWVDDLITEKLLEEEEILEANIVSVSEVILMLEG